MPPAIETIRSEHDFKVLCDGLLRFHVSPLVQTFGGSGKDGGVDAEFDGELGALRGRWVFQFKFRSPELGLSQRRAWLKSRFAGKDSEFDRDGIRGAAGYVVLTNIPVTPALVNVLKRGLHSRRGLRNVAFCVWDPTRLNSLLKGHEHLARSWTGLREARCRRAIIKPLWAWLGYALSATESPSENLLWPLKIETFTRYAAAPRFGLDGIIVFNGTRIASEVGTIIHLKQDPDFRHAFAVAYPRALGPLEHVENALRSLENLLLAEIAECEKEVEAGVPQLRQLEGRERDQARTAMAFAVLDQRFGVPSLGAHVIKEGCLLMHGAIGAWGGTRLEGLEEVLSRLIAVRQGFVPSKIERARRSLHESLVHWWQKLWFVIELGIDAEL